MTVSARDFNRLQELVDNIRKQLDENGNADRRERVEFSQNLSRLETKIESLGSGDSGDLKNEVRDLRSCLDDNTVNDRVEREKLSEKIKKLEADLKFNTENDVRVGEELQLIVNTMRVSKTWMGRGVVLILFGAFLWLLMQFIQFTVSGKHIVDSLQVVDEPKNENSFWAFLPVQQMNEDDLKEMANNLPFETAVELGQNDDPTLENIVKNLPRYVIDTVLKDQKLKKKLFADEEFRKLIVQEYFNSRDKVIAAVENEKIIPYDLFKNINIDSYNAKIVPSEKARYEGIPNCANGEKLKNITDGVELLIPKNREQERMDNSMLRYLNCRKYRNLQVKIKLVSSDRDTDYGTFSVKGFVPNAEINEIRVVIPPNLAINGEKLTPKSGNVDAIMTIVSINNQSVLY